MAYVVIWHREDRKDLHQARLVLRTIDAISIQISSLYRNAFLLISLARARPRNVWRVPLLACQPRQYIESANNIVSTGLHRLFGQFTLGLRGLLFLGVMKSEFMSSQSQSSAPAMRESMSTLSATCRARSRFAGDRYVCFRLGVLLGNAFTFLVRSGVRGGGAHCHAATACRRGEWSVGPGTLPSSSAKISSSKLLSSASERFMGGIVESSGRGVEGVVVILPSAGRLYSASALFALAFSKTRSRVM